MSDDVPHTYPPRPWHHALAACAVGVQALALLRAARWLSPGWAVAFALLAAAVTALLARVRRPGAAAVASLALLAGAFAGAVVLVRDVDAFEPLREGRVKLFVALALAVWLWVLHAPLTLTRAWVRLHPAQDAALEAFEPLGYLLVASAAGLLLARTSPGTAPWAALTGAPGVAVLAWVAARQVSRRRWLRRVRDGLDPRWRLAPGGEVTGADPWTHAAGEEALPEVLEAREGDGLYRASARRVAVARAGGRDERAWRARRALRAAAALWGVGVAAWGAVTLLRVDDPWLDVVEVVRSLHVSVDPCMRGPYPGGGLVASGQPDENDPTRFNVYSNGLLFVSRANREVPASDDVRFRCVDPAIARGVESSDRVLGEPARATLARLLAAPEVRAPSSGRATCPAGRWRSIAVRQPMHTNPHLPSVGWWYFRAESLDAAGRWVAACAGGHDVRSGQIPAGEARALLDAVEYYAARTSARELVLGRFVAHACAVGGDFPASVQLDEAWSLVARKLCAAALHEP